MTNSFNKVRISSSSDRYFEEFWQLYIGAFPAVERRELDYQIATMQSPSYYLDIILDGDSFIGFMGWWQIGSVKYIEHFATLPSLRGGGYGAKILSSFIEASKENIILEVEHPEDDISKRRIGFYQRLGLHLNPHFYAHPAYWGEGEVELMIMSYPTTISSQELEQIKAQMFPMVHFGASR